MITSILTLGKSAAIALVLVLAGAISASAATITITIKNLSFSPAEVTAKVGDTIMWDNKDVIDHTATARDKSFDVVQPAKKSISQTLTKAGTFDYYCRYHPNMKGRLIVGQ